MSEDVYTLKYPTNEEALKCLNRLSENRIELKVNPHAISEVDEVEDWANGIKSGKKIVNPLSPREEIRAIRNKYCQQIRADGRKILIEQHDYCLLLLYAEKAVEEGEGND